MAVELARGRAEFLPLPLRGPFRSEEEILWGKIANVALDGAFACLSLDLQDQWEPDQTKKERGEIEEKLKEAFYLCGVMIEGPQMRDKPTRGEEQWERRRIYDDLLGSIVGEWKPFFTEAAMAKWAEDTRTFFDQAIKLGKVLQEDKEELLGIQEKFTEIAGAYIYKQGM